MMNMEVNIAVNIQATRKFYKVIVISVGLYESDIVNEKTLCRPYQCCCICRDITCWTCLSSAGGVTV